MKQYRKTGGFTLAELLVVVAIIAILGGVGFVAVQNYQRNLALLERDTIAKEIFVAAQNHLTMADSQGYNGVAMDDDSLHSSLTQDEGSPVYAVMYDGTFTPAQDVLLPFGSIDETVRKGGSYIIRYQSNPANVMDVFYWTPSDALFGKGEADYQTMFDNRENRGWRKGSGRSRPVIGWYGGGDTLAAGTYDLKAPTIEVENAERLMVRVTNANTDMTDTKLKLIIVGKTSEAQLAIDLALTTDRVSSPAVGKYEILLDAITESTSAHFANLTADTVEQFIPGEDIVVQAVVFTNSRLSNIAYSSEITTNSLFADIEEGTDENTYTALVGNVRHLENLDNHISNLAYDHEKQKLTSAKQIVDLCKPEEEGGEDLGWKGFLTAIGSEDAKIYAYDESGEDAGTKEGCFRPISPDYALTYDGQGHSISDVKVDYTGDAGLFGSLKDNSSVSNLALVDFDINAAKPDEGTANAGTLAGTLNNTIVSNVLATSGATGDNVKAADGSAGGLVGSLSGGRVEKSAAAVTVNGATAGGLIGTASGAMISASYAAGHTDAGEYYQHNDDGTRGDAIYNVTGAGTAGGLVGDAGNSTIEKSYSTCSVRGLTAGGFVGTSSGDISNSYCTGLVSEAMDEAGKPVEGAKAFAFAASCTGTLSGNYYYDIINERPAEDDGFTYLAPTGSAIDDPAGKLDALDGTAQRYDAFVGAPTDWKAADAYDGDLKTYYQEKFNLKTVEQLGAALKADEEDATVYFAATHYGDWPAPEIFVFNAA